ncbi:hypothetical protein HF329_12885 [Chitinophaga oryzae]|uniref:YD repeat-containing protein n=1 Tax=Chitinophaga oryzae TaxID=2725414 RepID=A0AAE6ZG43_9BACT|nr:hypothetical protein [Chitinophaga oryzae]QJB32173.1 hypothetical protein HF329_12885 [Chitinophaga oryzae]
MKHRKTARNNHHSALSVALLGIALVAGSACNKAHLPEVGHSTNGENVAATPAAAPAPNLLTRIRLGGADGLIHLISYNKRLQPAIITQYAGSMLLQKDTVVYDANGKLQKVLHYSPNFLSAGKFMLSGSTKFEWDAKGNISRKTTYDLETGKLEEDEKYAYDAGGNLVTVTSVTGGGTNLKFVTSYAYELKNIKKETVTDGSKVISLLSVAGFDQHPTYITHPLLRYLLEGAGHETFSDQNPLETRKIQYVNLNGKQDSIVTVQKNAYTYNSANRPVKVAFTSMIYSTGGQKPVNSKGNTDYEYSK